MNERDVIPAIAQHIAEPIGVPEGLRSVQTLVPTVQTDPGSVRMGRGESREESGSAPFRRGYDVEEHVHVSCHRRKRWQRCEAGRRLECAIKAGTTRRSKETRPEPDRH